MTGVAVSSMRNTPNHEGENEFSEMELMNITVITSNEPYGVYDKSNPNFEGKKVPRFNLKIGGVHSGHVQLGLRDPFCFVKNGKGKCKVTAFHFVGRLQNQNLSSYVDVHLFQYDL